MSNETKAYKRIRAEDVHEVKSWTLPQMGQSSAAAILHKTVPQVTVVEEVIAAEKITVAELESIREAARIEGLSAGLEEGRKQGKEEGRAEGIAEGRDKGYQEGFKQGEADVLQRQEMLQNLLLELQHPLEQSTDAIEARLVDLVISLAEATVGAELATRKVLLLAAIQDALKQLPEPVATVQLKVNAEDVAFIEQSLIPLDSPVSIDIQPTDKITSGGYQIKTDHTLIQDEVEVRFAAVVKQFHDNLSHETAGDHE